MKVVTFLIVTVICILSICNAANSNPIYPKVRVDVFYETKCPDSIRFIKTQMWPTYKELTGIVDFNVYPYGNCNQTLGKEGLWEFKCQHHEKECALNQIATCVNYIFTKSLALQYVVCAAVLPTLEGAVKCSMKLGLNWSWIKKCSQSKQGNELQHKMGVATPKHSFIPWIRVNGKMGGETQKQAVKDLRKLVCQEYTGPKPKVCTAKME